MNHGFTVASLKADDNRLSGSFQVKWVGWKMVGSRFRLDVATVTLEDHRTVNVEHYATVCLPTMFVKVQERRPRSGDSASSHTMTLTIELFTTSKVEAMSHTPTTLTYHHATTFVCLPWRNICVGGSFYENLVSEVSWGSGANAFRIGSTNCKVCELQLGILWETVNKK